MLVELPALVVEAMSDLVPDNLDFKLVYNSSTLLCYIPLFLAVQDSSIGDLVTHSVSQ